MRDSLGGITLFHGNDGVDDGFVGPLRAGPLRALGRKQHAVLSFLQHTVQMQQSGGLQNDGGTENAYRANEKGTQTGDDPIGGAQVGRTLASAIENLQCRTNADSATTERSPPGLASRATVTIKGTNTMSKSRIPAMVSAPQEPPHSGQFRPIWQFAMDKPF
jgi:hypothetical protein